MKKESKDSCIIQPQYKKPNIFLYAILWVVVYFVKFLLNFKIDKEERKKVRKLKCPILVLANHQSAMDFGIMTHALFPKRLSFVVAAKMFYNRRFAWAIRAIKCCIPKKQFTTDFECVKSIKKMIDSGVSVAIYPEGRNTVDGRSGVAVSTIYKLIKWLNVPVVYVQTQGMYLTNPRYATDLRRGRVKISLKEIISKQDLDNNISIDEIKKRVDYYTQVNDFIYQQENNIRFKAKKGTTIGLPYLLYKCPRCQAEGWHFTSLNTMICKECNNGITLDEYGLISPIDDGVCFDRIDLWYQYQIDCLKKEIYESDDYKISASVVFLLNNDEKRDFVEHSKGVLELSINGFCYISDSGEKLTFGIPNPPVLAIELLGMLDFFVDNAIYRFKFIGDELVVKFDIATQLLFEKRKELKEN